MARKKTKIAQVKKLLEHTKIKPLPEWKDAFTAHRQIQKMTDKQFQIYSAIVDHHRGKVDIKKFYPMVDTKHIDALKGVDKEALDSLARNMGSKGQLSRWHRKTWSHSMKGGSIGSALKTGAKVTMKAAKYLAKKGVELAGKMWNTTKKVVSQLGKLGKSALTWALNPDNQKKIANLIELVKQGIGVAQLIGGLGDSGPIPAKELETVSADKKADVAALMDDTDDDTSGDESTDEEGKTVGEMD